MLSKNQDTLNFTRRCNLEWLQSVYKCSFFWTGLECNLRLPEFETRNAKSEFMTVSKCSLVQPCQVSVKEMT